MRSFRLNKEEHKFINDMLNNAILTVGMRDRKRCCECACKAILGDRRMYEVATATLRPVILAHLTASRERFFFGMLQRNVAYLGMPKSLGGKALYNTARDLGLVVRKESVRVDVETIKEECNLAKARMDMNMPGEVGRECNSQLLHKLKIKECINRIVQMAQRTGVADITMAWREFASHPDTLTKVALKAISRVSVLKNVYVLDIHGLKCLYPYGVFKEMLHLLSNSAIFAVNMGEDNMILDMPHFTLLAAKIEDGSIAVRRWFVECTPQRRVTLTHCRLVSPQQCMQTKRSVTSPNIFTIARRVDKAMWVEGRRHESRLSWLSAPKSAYNAARKHNTTMQNSTCKWSTACALRDAVKDRQGLCKLATVASLVNVVQHG